MSEMTVYELNIDKNRIAFTECAKKPPDFVLAGKFAAHGDAGATFVCRMGDPDLIHCAVYRCPGQGGYFSLHDKSGPLFAAIAGNNLVYGMAWAFFGEMVANARYGVDVFENMEEPDD